MTQWGLDTLFNPAKRHMDEEKRRLQSTREEIGDASGGKRIDFESGKVTITRTAHDDEADEAEAREADTRADGSDDSGKHAAGAKTADDAKPAHDAKTAEGAKTANGAKTAEAAKPTDGSKPKPAPSAAAIRAAQRRGRQPR